MVIMKNIKLTEEHKSKLLEMCKILFPEYDFTLDKWSQCFVTLGLKSKDLYEEHIHWFEFCMTHLKDILQDKLEEMNKLDYDYQIKTYDSWYESHPIDYLYEEFKKIQPKQEQYLTDHIASVMGINKHVKNK